MSHTAGANLQHLVNGLTAEWQKERAREQMTLGDLIEALEDMPPDTMIQGIYEPHAYRGYYHDLAFEPAGEKISVAETLPVLRMCLGEGFQGYKGGTYYMTKATPVWIAHWGSCGVKIMGVDAETGELTTAEDK